MCGIAGRINRDNAPISRETFLPMVDCIAHRGPDAEGVYFENGLALGHRRLAIIDLTDNGIQPMKLMERYVVVYNGEIYNYIELREELQHMGYSFETKTDTEVLVKAYDAWREKAVDRFNGMWAFAIFDRIERSLFLSRDRFGIKPLYYYENNDLFVFGSEIKQLLPYITGGLYLERDKALDYLINALTDYKDDTFFRGVKQLQAGWNGYYDLHTHRFWAKRWYDLSKVPANHCSYQQACTEFGVLFRDAVRLRLRADVAVGACLSGGLDSSAILCEMARLRKEEHGDAPMTISSCYTAADEARWDEQEYIDAVVAETGVVPQKVYPHYESTMEELDDLIYHMDEPFGSMSICAQRAVFAGAKQCKRTVMLDGQGADEQLAGYTGFFVPAIYDAFKRARWIALAQTIAWYQKNRSAADGRPAYFFLWPILQDVGLGCLKKTLKRLLRRGPAAACSGSDSASDALFYEQSDYCKKELYPIRDFKQFTLNMIEVNLLSLLHYEDRNSMTFSIESRVPFLDYRLVEFIYSLPAEYKLRKGITKAVMRDALKGRMTEKIRTRTTKLGFAAPEALWVRQNTEGFRKELITACDALPGFVNKQNALKRFDSFINGEQWDGVLFRLVILARWMNVFHVELAEGTLA